MVACALVLAGCFADPQGDVGPCTLHVSVVEQGILRMILQPPYTIHLGTPAQATNDPSSVTFSGTRWQRAELLMRHASGEQVTGSLTAADLFDASTAFMLPRAGQWDVTVSDAAAGCRRHVMLEAIEP
jgi:hypothetical protein